MSNDPTPDAERFWEDHYRRRTASTTIAPHPVVAETVAGVDAGRALELGSGHGDTAVWLARRAWEVTAVDISATALARLDERAVRHGVAARLRTERHDLMRSSPEGRFELVYALYLESPIELDAAAAMRRAADTLEVDGQLVWITHGSTRPWAWNRDPSTTYPSAEVRYADLGLDPAAWRPVRLEAVEREATGPTGQVATVTDTVVHARRSRR